MNGVAQKKFRRLDGVAVGVRCPYCHKPIHFVKTTHGRQMPCEMDLLQGDGVKTLVSSSGVTTRKAGPEVWGYEPHWAFCKFGQAKEGGAK